MDWDSLVFNSCAFIASVVLLQIGANLFTDNSATIARRYGVPETLIVLLTAGAGWKELAVVVASSVQHHPSLGLGSVVGSCVSNVMGAFALGILLTPNAMPCGLSAKIYSGALFVVSTIFTLLAFTQQLNLPGGIFLIVGFTVYVFSIFSAIYDGILDPEPDPHTAGDVEELRVTPRTPTEHQQLHVSIYPSVLQCHPNEASPFLPVPEDTFPSPAPVQPLKSAKTSYHVSLLLGGLVSLGVAAYVLAHAACSLATSLKISNALIGVTLVAISTTIINKVISVGNTGVLTATTAGSNIFLLTLCVGVIFVTNQDDTDPEEEPGARRGLLAGNLVAFEVWCVWASSLFLVLITWIGARQWLGALLFGLYVGFVGTDLSYFKR